MKSLQNKLIGISTLKESSKAEDIFSILLKEKLLFCEKNKEKLVGILHDNVETLSGERNGLLSLLRKDISQCFYNLSDPCHCLNLVVKHSLDVFPKEILEFIEKIDSHFSYPQRKARLKRIQHEKNKPIKLLQKFVMAKWLNLGLCLTRLLEIERLHGF